MISSCLWCARGRRRPLRVLLSRRGGVSRVAGLSPHTIPLRRDQCRRVLTSVNAHSADRGNPRHINRIGVSSEVVYASPPASLTSTVLPTSLGPTPSIVPTTTWPLPPTRLPPVTQ